MPVSGQEILSYKGNAGLGSNSDIPAIGNKGLEVINNSLDRLQAQNSIRNQQIFQQKIRDRDALYAAIDSGDIKVPDILDQDMPTVKEGLEKLDEAYFKRIKNGINDLDAARDYKKALREAQDRVTQATARKLHFDKLNGEIAKEQLPRKQEAMKAHLDKTINSGFFSDLTPYQQTQDLDVAGSILSAAATQTEQFTDPKNPLIKGKRTLFDYDKTFLNSKDNFLNDVNKRYDQQQLVGAIQSLPPAEFLETIKAVNDRIKEYNAIKNLAPGQPGYVADVKFTVNPQTGKAMINEAVPDFAAKYTLAHQRPFGSAETELDEAAYKLLQEQNKVRHEKAMERIGRANAAANLKRANAYAALQGKKLSQLNDDEKRVKNFWDGIVSKVKQKDLDNGDGRGKITGDFVFAGDLPQGYHLIGGIDSEGKPIPLVPKTGPNGTEYYETKFYDSQGNSVDLLTQYKNWVKNDGGKGSYEELRNKLLKSGAVNMELVGENGTGNFETAFQTARTLSNKNTAKGETPVFTEENEE
jgi:hypothetical protein